MCVDCTMSKSEMKDAVSIPADKVLLIPADGNGGTDRNTIKQQAEGNIPSQSGLPPVRST